MDVRGIKMRSRGIELEAGGLSIQCTLFNKYVDQLNNFIKFGEVKNCIITLQFAKTTSFEGMVHLHSCLSFTRVIFNPLSSYGICMGTRIHPLLLTHLAFDQRVELTNDFLYNTQRATMLELNEAVPGQFYVVIGTIKRVINPSNFGYTACKCSRGVEPEMQMLPCRDCEDDVNNLCARYFLRIQATDQTGCLTLILLDSVARAIFNKTCSEMLQQNEHAVALGQVPHDIYRLVNQTLLFKVEKNEQPAHPNQSEFIVRKICMDAFAINEFQRAKQFKGIGNDLIMHGEVGIPIGAKPDDVGTSSNKDEARDENEAEDINVIMNLYMANVQI